MENTLLIQGTNEKALGLLHQLEELHLIKILKEDEPVAKPKLSEKYGGIIPKEYCEDLNEHIKRPGSCLTNRNTLKPSPPRFSHHWWPGLTVFFLSRAIVTPIELFERRGMKQRLRLENQ